MEMTNFVEVPLSYEDALKRFHLILRNRDRLKFLTNTEFLNGWGALFYIAPGLHPDEWDNPEGGWPIGWRCFGEEAFRRHAAELIGDTALYPSECSHASLANGRAA